MIEHASYAFRLTRTDKAVDDVALCRQPCALWLTKVTPPYTLYHHLLTHFIYSTSLQSNVAALGQYTLLNSISIDASCR